MTEHVRRNKKRYRLTKKTYFMLGGSVLLLLLLIVLIFKGCQKEPLPPTPMGDGVTLSENRTGDLESYLDETVFVGDSRTVGFVSYSVLPESQVLAREGMTHMEARTEGFLEDGATIAETLKARKPKRVVVSFGINGLEGLSGETFLSEYRLLLQELLAASPDSQFIVQSIFPISAALSTLRPEMGNSVITERNGQLKTLCAELSLSYLDSATALALPDGSLDPDCDAGDGLHLSPTAYTRLVTYFTSHQAAA